MSESVHVLVTFYDFPYYRVVPAWFPVFEMSNDLQVSLKVVVASLSGI